MTISLLAAGAALVALSAGAVIVPTDTLQNWRNLSYNDIPANTIEVVGGSLHVRVDKSSSPLVYKLEIPVAVRGIRVDARWSGDFRLPAGEVQGSKAADDFILKVGLVEAGEQRLNWFQRRIAADWILRLYELAPEGGGVKRINFLSTTQQRELLGNSRLHPLNDLLHEERVTFVDGPGEFTLARQFDEPVTTLGLWISTDGDNTQSSFDLYIETIELQVAGN